MGKRKERAERTRRKKFSSTEGNEKESLARNLASNEKEASPRTSALSLCLVAPRCKTKATAVLVIKFPAAEAGARGSLCYISSLVHSSPSVYLVVERELAPRAPTFSPLLFRPRLFIISLPSPSRGLYYTTGPLLLRYAVLCASLSPF